MSSQLTLSGQTTEQKSQEERDAWTMKFYQEECLRLKIIQQVVEKGEGKFEVDGAEIIFKKGKPNTEPKPDKDKDWDLFWRRKKFLGEWWYCNAIKGWNNNTPQEEDLYKGNDYDSVPDNDMMANSIRSCFISVDRDGINWDRKYCLERLTMAIKCYLKNIKEFGKTEEKSFKENVKNAKEIEKVENLCIECKKDNKEDNCVSELRELCFSCQKNFYKKTFEELDMPNGFKDCGDSYKFYSQTTKEEEVRKDRIMEVIYDVFPTEIFGFSVITCDEFGSHENTYGITNEFSEHLIKEMKLVKTIEGEKSQIEFNGEEFHTSWRNPKIKQDEKGKKLAELKKELAEKKKDMMDKLKEIRELENGEKEKK